MKVTQQALAAHLYCTAATITAYAASGLIKRGKTGYDEDECRKAVLTHLRDKAGGRMGNAEGMNLTAEKAKRERSQTEKNTFALNVLKGMYVLTEEACQEVERLFGIVRERLLAIPGMSADHCAEGDAKRREHIKAILDEDIGEALDALSGPEDVIRAAATKNMSGLEAATEAEPDPVGGPTPQRGGKDKRKPRQVED